MSVACVTAAAPAFAGPGDNDDAPIIGTNNLETPSVMGRAWTIEGRFASSYDSNFRRRPVAQGAVRLRPLLHVGAGLPVGRQQLFFGADVGRDIVVNQPGFSRGRYAVGGGVDWRLGTRCSGVVGAEALQRMTMVTDQAELTNNSQNIRVATASLGCRSATGFGFGGSVERRSVSNDTFQRAPFDLRSTVLAPNISYGTPTLGQFSVTATFNKTSYPNRFALTPTGSVDEGINILQSRLGYQRSFGQRLQIGFGVSYLKTKAQPATILTIVNNQIVPVTRDGFNGGGYDGSITYTSSRMSLSLVGSRNVTVSPNVGAQFIIRNAYSADYSYRIGPSLDFGLGGRIQRNQYKQSFTTPDSIARVRDNSKRVYASLDYSPVPLYSIGLEVAHQWRRSDPVEFNFDGTTARLNLRVKLGRG